MNDQTNGALVGELVDAPGDTIQKPPSREQKIEAYQKEHYAEYRAACDDAQCTCSPTKAQMLIINNYQSPPID